MRLRARLALAFALFALLPTLVVAVVSRRAAELAFAEVAAADAARARGLVEEALAELGQALEETLGALAAPGGEASRLSQGRRLGLVGPAGVLGAGADLIEGRPLDLLFLLDAEGVVLSAAHLPGSFGASAPDLAELGSSPALRKVERRREGQLEQTLALVAARRVDRGALTLVGGRALDGAWIAGLEARAGLALHLEEAVAPDAAPEAHPIPEAGPAPEAGPRLPLGTLDGAPVWLRLERSDQALRTLQRSLDLALGLAALLAVLGGAGVGAWLAGRITAPVEALAVGARAVAAGDYGVQVEAAAGGELGALVTAFNTMSADVRRAQGRIAAAERVAAWQEVAQQLAHEVKNPLTPIAVSVETLRRARARAHPDFGEIFDESTQAILEEVEALKRLVTEFSRFARLPQPRLAPVDLAELARGVATLYDDPGAAHAVTLALPAGLPLALGDRDLLQQVLVNLVANAVEALVEVPPSAAPTLTLGAAPWGEGVRLWVEDNGPGVAPELEGRLFSPYVTTKETGTGLGLAISLRALSEQGGTLDLEVPERGGARFVLWLPKAGEEA